MEAETKSILVVGQNLSRVEPSDEIYVEATMPIGITAHAGEQRVLGVRLNVVTDRLI